MDDRSGLKAAGIDELVASRLLAALAPDEIAVALAAAEEVSERHARSHRALELRVERARYDAARAERAFHACEPENRLVARSLETRWETKLRELTEAETELAEQTAPAPEPSREQLEALARDVPAPRWPRWEKELRAYARRQVGCKALLTRGLRQRLGRQPLAPITHHQLAALRAAVVIEHRLDPLLPLRALLTELVAQTHPRPQIEDVIRRDPRLRQPLDHQQLTQMPGVRPVALRALLRTTQPRGLRRLARCTSAPTRRSSSTTNRQPVVASSATSSSWPPNRSRNRRTPARSTGATRPRLTSPVSVSSQSAVICARC